MAKAGEFKFFFRVWLYTAAEEDFDISVFYPALECTAPAGRPYADWFRDAAAEHNWEGERVARKLNPEKRYQFFGQASVTVVNPGSMFDEYDEEFDIIELQFEEVPDSYYVDMLSLE